MASDRDVEGVRDEVRTLAVDCREQFGEIRAQFAEVDRRFEDVYERFEAVDQRFDAVDQRFDQVDHRFDLMDARFDSLQHELVATFERGLREAITSQTRVVVVSLLAALAAMLGVVLGIG